MAKKANGRAKTTAFASTSDAVFPLPSVVHMKEAARVDREEGITMRVQTTPRKISTWLGVHIAGCAKSPVFGKCWKKISRTGNFLHKTKGGKSAGCPTKCEKGTRF
jgi:hypothetical protein